MLSTVSRSAWRIVAIRRSVFSALTIIGVGGVELVTASPLSAQTASPQVAPLQAPGRVSPSRSVLEAAAVNFERRGQSEKDAGKRETYLRQAQLIRARLTQGDFQPGHRILLFVAGDSALSDTFTVRSDRKLQLPNLPEISLTGVLDSELQGHLQTQLAQYVRNPSVRAQALLRVSVSGDVANPGFYAVRTDTPVSDVIMTAGGPSQAADLSKTVLRRGTAVVVKRDGMQEAFRSEMTMSDIGARPGDELFIPSKPGGSRWTKIAAATASITGIVWTLVYIAGRR